MCSSLSVRDLIYMTVDHQVRANQRTLILFTLCKWNGTTNLSLIWKIAINHLSFCFSILLCMCASVHDCFYVSRTPALFIQSCFLILHFGEKKKCITHNYISLRSVISPCVPFGRAHPYVLIPSKGLPSGVKASKG